jgi:hypothetical protein
MFKLLKPSAVTLDVMKSAIRTYLCWPFGAFFFAFWAFGYCASPYVASHEIESKDISNLLLTYNALVLSFSLASITLVIALPSREFVFFLAKEREQKNKKIIPLKSLILSYFQAAFAHYVALALVTTIFLFGPDRISVRLFFSAGDWVSIIFLFQTWAFFLFGLALKDVASLGVLYANHLVLRNPEPVDLKEQPSDTDRM